MNRLIFIVLFFFCAVAKAVTPAQSALYYQVVFPTDGHIINVRFGIDSNRQYNVVMPLGTSAGDQNYILSLPQFNNFGYSGIPPIVTLGNVIDPAAIVGGTGTVTVVSSGSLTATALVTGGGLQTLQTPSATATMDSSGNIRTTGTLTTGASSSTAGAVVLGQGTTQSTGANNVTIEAPASVTSYVTVVPGTVGSNGAFLTQTTSGSTATLLNTKLVPSGVVVGDTDTQTLQNKRITARITSIASNATPAINTDTCDCVNITALAVAITSMTITGTPVNFDTLEFRILDNGTPRAITWGASFVAGPVALPTTTVTSKALHAYFEWDAVRAAWVCMYSGSDT